MAPDPIRDKVVAVTGASGSIGGSLVASLLAAGAREVRALSRSDARYGFSSGVVPVRGDLRDPAAIAQLVAGADGVFHLAGMKAVGACETDPRAAVETNVLGTLALVTAARAAGVAWLVAASSTKACRPHGVYGLTKALLERAVMGAQRVAGPRFSAVRLAGVLDGTGSVLSGWHADAAARRPISVTDPEMTRFVTLRTDAIRALTSAALDGLRGEVLVPVAAAYRLGELAEAFAHRSGASIAVVGPRRGEARHEDLLAPEETPFARTVRDAYVIGDRPVDPPVVAAMSSDRARHLSGPELEALIDAAG